MGSGLPKQLKQFKKATEGRVMRKKPRKNAGKKSENERNG